jgi:uncharacterized protein YkwD
MTRTTNTPTNEPTPTSAQDLADIREQVVMYTNEYRRQNGCEDLKLDTWLTQAAQGHSEDMANNDTRML